MFFQTVQLDTTSVVYVDILLLRDGEELIIVKPSYVYDDLAVSTSRRTMALSHDLPLMVSPS